MTLRLFITFAALTAFTFSSISCIPLAVGATAGYVAHDQGYRVQAPIKKTEEEATYYDEKPNY